MGSSKKHKEKEKDHKRKKKHRSRSRSRERKHKKEKRDERHDKRLKRERDEDEERYYEEGEIPGLDLVKKEEPRTDYEDYQSGSIQPGEESGAGGGDSSLSIDETNRLRAKLGLKPLDVGTVKAEDNDDAKPTKKEDVHVPAANLTEMKKTEKLREKMEQIREKRKLNQKLGKVRTLGESDDEDGGALAWIKKSRKLQRDKEEAEKRAKMLDAMDEEFGISGLIDEEFADTKKTKEYGSKDLRGLTVEHGEDAFTEGKTVILTLKDKGILEEGEENDILMNVNMADNERYKESVENKKKKPAYNPYDDSQIDEFGMPKPRDILDKYNEEIDGKKKDRFLLGSGGQYDAQHERQMKKFKEDIAQKGETLVLPSPVVASEFYTEQEMATFKKTKKKVRKIRRKPKTVTADDLIPLDSPGDLDHGSRGARKKGPHEESEAAIPGLDLVAMEVDINPVADEEVLGPEEDLTGVAVEDDAMNDLQTALSKARKLKQRKKMDPEKKVLQHVREVGMEEGSDDEEPSGSKLPGPNIVLNSTSEFCRTLGDIPTYGQAGNREEDEEELLDFERELAEERRRKLEEEEMGTTGWMSVEIDETPVDIAHEEKGPLDEEPTLNSGIASALQLGLKKGYFEQEKIKKISAPKHKVLEAKNYSIEDKRYDDLDEKYNKRRDRFGSGISMEFKDLSHYKPDIKIDYIDESGRNLNQKEAFRALSHRFHGKGSGKRKQEKRSKKLEQENLLMQASSTDTPLGTVAMLQEKQKQEKTPYIVLSGSNKGMTASTLTKS